MPTSARLGTIGFAEGFRILDVHSVGPLENFEFAADFRKNGLFCRADVGIGPYRDLRPQAHAANFFRADTAITNNDGLRQKRL